MAASTQTRDYAAICRAHQAAVLEGRVPASPNYKASIDLQVAVRENPPEGYVYDDAEGDKALRFIEMMNWGKGTKRGKPIILENWQVALLHPLFALVDPVTRARLYTSTSWWLSKGSGKSPLAALVNDYLFATDKTGGEFYSFATTQKQARIVFTHAQEFLRQSPRITERFRLNVSPEHQIRGIGDPRICEPRSAESGSIEGGAPRLAVLDEVHLQIDDRLYQNIKTACDKVDGSLLLMISTCGVDAGPDACGMRLYNRARDIIQGKVKAPREYVFIIDADKQVDPWSRLALEQACPNLGVSQSLPNLLEAQTRAKQTPSDQADFKIKHLNQWVQAASAFIDMDAWRKLARSITIEETLDDPEWQDASWFVGVDLARTRDLIAAPVVAVRMRKDGGRQYRCFTKMAWLPELSITVENTPALKDWRDQGWITLTPGKTFNPSILKADVIPQARAFPNCEVCFDEWCALELEEDFASAGLEVVPVRQGARTQSEPMKALEAATLDASLEHDGSPLTEWCMGNLMGKRDPNGNVRPDRPNEYAKIDVAVALINAFVSASVAELEPYQTPEEREEIRKKARGSRFINFNPRLQVQQQNEW